MKKYKELVFFDTETTGKDVEDRLCQLGYIHEEESGEKQISFMNLMFKPPLPIKIEAMTVHHITNEAVENLESFEVVAKDRVKALFEREDVICIAHNAKFDVDMLRKEGVIPTNVIDTLKVARHLDKEGAIPSHALQYLRYFLKLDVGEVQAHDAFGDVKVLAALFNRLMQKFNGDTMYDEMIEISKRPSMIPRFNFGKYKGEKISDVASRDSGYLRWLKGSESEKQTPDEDLIYTLKKFV